MLNRNLLLSLSGALFFASGAAHADVFTINFTSASYAGHVVVTGTTDPYQSDAYDVSSVTGTLTVGNNMYDIVLAPGVPSGLNSHSAYVTDNSGLFWIDNVLYPNHDATAGGGHGFVDWWGILFKDANGSTIYNLFSDNGDNNYTIYSGTPGSGFGGGPGPTQEQLLLKSAGPAAAQPLISVTTPEPSSLGLLGTGVLGMAGLLRRKPRAA